MKFREIRPLNEHERESIRIALTHYIETHTDKQSWSQKVIRDEMLENLLWASFE